MMGGRDETYVLMAGPGRKLMDYVNDWSNLETIYEKIFHQMVSSRCRCTIYPRILLTKIEIML